MRVRELDLARGLGVALMLSAHVILFYGTPAVNASTAGRAYVAVALVMGAPLFMLLLGTSLAFTRRATTAQQVWRGLLLLAIGYALNAARAAPLVWAVRRLGAVPAEVASYMPTSFAAALTTVDILQFAGLSLLVLAPFTFLLRHPRTCVVLAALIAVVSPRLWGLGTGWAPLDHIARLLWGDDGAALFPMFPMLSYVVAGRALGIWLAGGMDRRGFFRRLACAGGVLAVASVPLIMTAPDYFFGDYFRSGPGLVAAITGVLLTWLAVCHRIVSRICASRVVTLLYFWSEHIAPMYLLHWLLLSWGMLIFGYRQQGPAADVVLMALMLILAHQGTRLWRTRNAPRTMVLDALPALAGGTSPQD